MAALRYIRASGGEPPGEERTVKAGDVAALADTALERLARLVAVFDDKATPYKACGAQASPTTTTTTRTLRASRNGRARPEDEGE